MDFELNLYSGTTHGFTRPRGPPKSAPTTIQVAMTRFFGTFALSAGYGVLKTENSRFTGYRRLCYETS